MTQKSKYTVKQITKTGRCAWFVTLLIALALCVMLVNPGFAQSQTPELAATVQPADPPANISFPESNFSTTVGTYPPLYEFPLALNPHDHFLFIRPLQMGEVTWPTADFRYGYYSKEFLSVHTGLDLVSSIRKPVYAAADGKVVFTGYGLLNGNGSKNDPYGIAVMIRHNFSFNNLSIYTVYAHLEKSIVEYGQYVKAGDKIGVVGMTGQTSGPHLHFEVRVGENDDSEIQNPELWLIPPVGYGVLAGTIKNSYGYLVTAKEIWLKSVDSGKSWRILTYAPKMTYNDGYYQENFVLNDLPQGKYEISLYYNYKYYQTMVNILPGAVNYVSFDRDKGFVQTLPQSAKISEFIQ